MFDMFINEFEIIAIGSVKLIYDAREINWKPHFRELLYCSNQNFICEKHESDN